MLDWKEFTKDCFRVVFYTATLTMALLILATVFSPKGGTKEKCIKSCHPYKGEVYESVCYCNKAWKALDN